MGRAIAPMRGPKCYGFRVGVGYLYILVLARNMVALANDESLNQRQKSKWMVLQGMISSKFCCKKVASLGQVFFWGFIVDFSPPLGLGELFMAICWSVRSSDFLCPGSFLNILGPVVILGWLLSFGAFQTDPFSSTVGV